VGYEDNRDAVKWQLQELVRELGGSHDLHAYVSSSAGPLWHVLTELPAWPAAGLTFRASVLPSAVAPFCLEASRLGEPLLLQAHAGNGVVVGHAAELSLDRAAALVQALRERAAAVRGQVVLLRCPPAWKSRLSVWGPSPESAWLMRTVKENLDPRRLFNPGRFVDGI
jgi:glycolate oxidase FAD binding subunit